MIKIIFPHTMVQDQISFQFYRKIMFNTKKRLAWPGSLTLSQCTGIVFFFFFFFFHILSFFFFLKFIIMTFHWVSNTPPPTHTHTHEAKLNKCTVWTRIYNKDRRSRYLLCLDIGQTFLWMKRRSINYKIKNTCSHAWLLHEYTFDWKGKHLPLIPWIEWLCSQLNTFVVILSEGLSHIICCDDSSGSWEKSNQNKTVLHSTILPALLLNTIYSVTSGCH